MTVHIDVNNVLLRDKKKSTQVHFHTERLGHKQQECMPKVFNAWLLGHKQ